MRLAELARIRWVLAAASIAFAASAVGVIAAHKPAPPPRVVQRHDIPVIGGCHQHRRKPPKVVPVEQPTAHEITGADYRDALMAIRPILTSCLKNADKSVQYRVDMDLAPNGSVKYVDVRSETKDLRKVSLKTVECLNAAVNTATFPASGVEKRVSTTLNP